MISLTDTLAAGERYAAENRTSVRHYTPLAIAAEVVGGALQPLFAAGLFPAQIRVCDPACGAGALLLVACEILARYSVVIGFERPSSRELSLEEARRAVAERCLVGGDVDAPAVEVAREQFRVFAGAVPDLRAADSFKETWPEVNCVVMNPPFMGGGKLSGALGNDYIKFLEKLHPGTPGRADIAAHFLRLGARVSAKTATLGFVATNTIAQGATRKGGWAILLGQEGYTVYNARPSFKWPGSAKVTVTIAHLARGLPVEEWGGIWWRSKYLKADLLNHPGVLLVPPSLPPELWQRFVSDRGPTPETD